MIVIGIKNGSRLVLGDLSKGNTLKCILINVSIGSRRK